MYDTETLMINNLMGSTAGSVVTAFAHGAMGRRIDFSVHPVLHD